MCLIFLEGKLIFYIYTTVQKSEVSFNVFFFGGGGGLSCSPRRHLFDHKCSKNMKYYYFK